MHVFWPKLNALLDKIGTLIPQRDMWYDEVYAGSQNYTAMQAIPYIFFLACVYSLPLTDEEWLVLQLQNPWLMNCQTRTGVIMHADEDPRFAEVMAEYVTLCARARHDDEERRKEKKIAEYRND